MSHASKRPELYRCGACSLAVVLVDGKLVRACSCTAPVVAEMRATMAGTGGLK